MSEPAEQNYQMFMRLVEKTLQKIEHFAVAEAKNIEHQLSQQAQDKRLNAKINAIENLNIEVKNQILYLERNYGLTNWNADKQSVQQIKQDLEPFRKPAPTLDHAVKNKAALTCMIENTKEELRKTNPSLTELRRDNKACIRARVEIKDKPLLKEAVQKKPERLSFDAACKNAIERAAKAAIDRPAPAKTMQQSMDLGR